MPKRRARWVVGATGAVLILAFLAIPGASQEPKKAPEPKPDAEKAQDVERVVQEQVEAYNRHDLDAFLKTYSPEIKLHQFPGQELGKAGLDEMRKNYGQLFRHNPELKVTIAKRIVQGDFVIDQEQVEMRNRRFTSVAVYEVKGGKIVNVWFLR